MRYIIVLAAFLIGCQPPTADTAASERDIEALSVAASPDGSKTAVAYSDMGGGAAGWCYVCVDVVPGAFSPVGARCGHPQQWFRCSTEVKLAWAAPTEVVATYDGEPAAELRPLEPAASLQGVSIGMRWLANAA